MTQFVEPYQFEISIKLLLVLQEYFYGFIHILDTELNVAQAFHVTRKKLPNVGCWKYDPCNYILRFNVYVVNKYYLQENIGNILL